MERSAMRELEILRLMANVGSCYRKDLMMAMNNSKTRSGGKSIARMCELGYLAESELIRINGNRKGQAVDIVSITLKGRIRLADAEHNDYATTLGSKIVNKRFATTTPLDLHRELARSRIALMLDRAGVRVFYADKPSFPRAHYLATQDEDAIQESSNEWAYNSELELDDMLDGCGVYYTLAEFKELFGADIATDTMTGTRVQGIYMSKSKTCVLFQTNIFESKTIKLATSTERRTLALIQSVTRAINGVSNIEAIVLTNSTAVIVDMCIGGKKGTVVKRERSTMRDESETANTYIGSRCALFDSIYCFPHTPQGVWSLTFFAEHQSEQEWAREIVEHGTHFTLLPEGATGNHLYMRDTITDDRAVILPYYEAKILGALHKSRENIAVVTRPEMADDIAHIARKQIAIYDFSENKIETETYQESGRPESYSEEAKPVRKKTYKPKYKKVSMEISEEDYRALRSVIYYTNTSMSHYLKSVLVPAIRADKEKYAEMRRLDEERRKAISKTYIPKD